jgi:UDP-4-amino-4,6-dideoxy-N-acetyl-beta-L-altrosamine N-acetyltransferase
MLITHSNLQLKTITTEDLELLRQWRNSEEVNRYLVNRPVITPEAQLRWHQNLNPDDSIYFMIIADSKKTGLAYARNINVLKKSFEGGIFIGEAVFADSFVPVKVALLLTVFFFDHVGFTSTYSTVHEENFKALDFDKKLGYREVSRTPPFILSKCTKNDFLSTADPLIKVLLRGENMQITTEPGDRKYSFLHNK